MAEQLAASQEKLRSVELISYLITIINYQHNSCCVGEATFFTTSINFVINDINMACAQTRETKGTSALFNVN
jgi:hypothetical protein